MKFKQLHKTLLLPLCAALTACSDEVLDALNPDKGKTPIVVTAGYSEGNDQSVSTRAVISDGTGKPAPGAFTENTSLYMLMKSEDLTTGSTNPAKVTRTIMFALPQSDNSKNFSDVNYTASNEEQHFTRYWEDSYSRNSALSIVAVCTPGMGAGIDNKTWKIGGNASYQSQLWTVIDNSKEQYPTVDWPIGRSVTDFDATDQNKLVKDKKNNDVSFIKNQDLCFSNNIEKHDVPAGYDHRLKFNSNGNRKFDSGTLIFYHALSKFTFLIKMGEGYTSTATDFKFAENKNIALENFYNKGTFNLENGEFNTPNESTDKNTIQRIYQRALTNEETSNYAYALEALVVPGTDMSTTDNALVIEIAGNEYRISRDKLYEAIKYTIEHDNNDATTLKRYFDDKGSSNYTKLKAGVHYVFSFTIGKTKIEKISASLVPWDNIEAVGQVPDNGYVNLELKDQTGNLETGNPKFDFYLAKDPTIFTGNDYNTWAVYNWNTGYEKKEVTWNSGKQYYQTPVFWPDNSTFYHFRTINRGLGVTTTSQDYVTMYSGPIYDTPTESPSNEHPEHEYSYTFSTSTTNGFNDYIWGAPFKRSSGDNHPQDATTVIPEYSTTTGYCNHETTSEGQIYKAIGATKETIFFYQLHMMSNIFVDLDNTNSSASNTDLVDLTDATVKIFRYAKSAKLQMGNGLVTGHDYSGTDAGIAMNYDASGNSHSPAYDYSYRMVPQQLKYTPSGGSEKTVGIEITCKDGNVYKIPDLSTITTSGGSTPINYWMPGKNYYYKFTLKKSGIDKIKATVVDWKNIEAQNQGVQIK